MRGVAYDPIFRAKLMALHEQGVPLTTLSAAFTSHVKCWAVGGAAIKPTISPGSCHTAGDRATHPRVSPIGPCSRFCACARSV